MLGASYLGVALTILLSCQPFHHFWQVTPDPGKLCQATNSPAYVLVVLITNIVTDLYLLSIPLPVSCLDLLGRERKREYANRSTALVGCQHHAEA